MTDPPIRRPFGAVPVADGLVEFRVWAPSATRVDVRLDDGDHDRRASPRASTRAASRRGRATTTATSSTAASRCPTRGRAASRRASSARRGSSTRRASCGRTTAGTVLALDELVLYELHVGTFTEDGTFDGRDPAPAPGSPSSA